MRPPGYACVRSVADGQDPGGVAGAFGANGTAGAVTDAAVEQEAAEDLSSGRERGGELGACLEDRLLLHL